LIAVNLPFKKIKKRENNDRWAAMPMQQPSSSREIYFSWLSYGTTAFTTLRTGSPG
jgi:hypothetical protein